MPILHAEPCLFPENLLTSPEGADRAWWAMYTLSRREKTLVRSLRGLGVPHYCPIVRHAQRSPAGRIRVSHLPLFSNYVFVAGDDTDRVQALATGHVSRCLPIERPQNFLTQIRSIQSMIETGREMTLESTYAAGHRVRVKSGPLLGAEGIVIERRGDRRLLVAVDFLQQGASVSLNDWDVERI